MTTDEIKQFEAQWKEMTPKQKRSYVYFILKRFNLVGKIKFEIILDYGEKIKYAKKKGKPVNPNSLKQRIARGEISRYDAYYKGKPQKKKKLSQGESVSPEEDNQ